jgi:hypothetical protein
LTKQFDKSSKSKDIFPNVLDSSKCLAVASPHDEKLTESRYSAASMDLDAIASRFPPGCWTDYSEENAGDTEFLNETSFVPATDFMSEMFSDHTVHHHMSSSTSMSAVSFCCGPPLSGWSHQRPIIFKSPVQMSQMSHLRCTAILNPSQLQYEGPNYLLGYYWRPYPTAPTYIPNSNYPFPMLMAPTMIVPCPQ